MSLISCEARIYGLLQTNVIWLETLPPVERSQELLHY